MPSKILTPWWSQPVNALLDPVGMEPSKVVRNGISCIMEGFDVPTKHAIAKSRELKARCQKPRVGGGFYIFSLQACSGAKAIVQPGGLTVANCVFRFYGVIWSFVASLGVR